MEKQSIDRVVQAIIPLVPSNNTTSAVSLEEIAKAVEKTREFVPHLFENVTNEDIDLINFRIGNHFNVSIGTTVILQNPNVERWLDSKKTEIDWSYYNAYKKLLQNQERPASVISENEKIIDSILDLSGDPTTEGKWARKGLVMGNVQSGKTQNYIGLINKAVDAGYKVIILLGGHLNDLRKQTQERVDEGFIGRESQHLINVGAQEAARIGVGKIREQEKGVATYTSTAGDFNRVVANQGIKLNSLSDPAIFTVKKNTSIMKNLSKWITDMHLLDEDSNLDMPLLLIDDEADFASINSKAHRDDITATNRSIREILSKFNKSTYIGYTATPFANIFIDPDNFDDMLKDDLFPKDFMIKIPVSEEYSGQDYFFNESYFDDNDSHDSSGPVRIIGDNEDMLPTKHNKYTTVGDLCPSLKEAIRVFILNICIRMLRGDDKTHNTMLINITHLNILQRQITNKIEDYIEEIIEAIGANHGLGPEKSLQSTHIKDLADTYNKSFEIEEDFKNIFTFLNKAANKLKVYGINNQSEQVLDYSLYRESGLAAIVIGGHKLSRGLTLEGLSISYFARNSKMYDTLLQMCRWFGYRPNYKDLCKVYTTSESMEWYCHISGVIKELYQELENMALQGKTPNDFGLKVRDHPGSLIVTSRAKMNYAGTAVHSIDLWGQQIRRFRFKKEDDFNNRNHKITEEFINKIKGSSPVEKGLSPTVYQSVPHEDIISYIRSMDMIPDDYGDDALIHQINQLKAENIPNFKVCLFNQTTSGVVKWQDKIINPENLHEEFSFASETINIPKRRMHSNGSIIFSIKSYLGNPDDEKLFLQEKDIDEVLDGEQKKYNNSYIRYKGRDFPSLMIYLFDLGILRNLNGEYPSQNEDYTATIAHEKPSIGYTISFPLTTNLTNKSSQEIRSLNRKTAYSYKINKIWEQMSLFNTHVEEDDF